MAFNRQLFDSINRKYKKAHDEITDLYYNQGKLSKEQFEILHELVWLLHEKERYDNGFYADHELPDDEIQKLIQSQDFKERIDYLNKRIPELLFLKQEKCKDFKYSFEK